MSEPDRKPAGATFSIGRLVRSSSLVVVPVTETNQNTPPQDPSLVPELLVEDVTVSLTFWVELCGFEIAYARLEEGFAYLTRGSAHVMLEQSGKGRNWITAPLEFPRGRGINFQISVDSVAPLIDRFAAEGWPLFMPPEEKWYQVGAGKVGLTQFLVQDPDGYLIRFSARLGSESAAG